LEPRVVSNKIGIHPIFTLIAMYTGFKLSGIIGLFIGPIILIILQNVFETMIDNGIVKSIFDRK
jgi:predicted PurR-regulated permease PerM